MFECESVHNSKEELNEWRERLLARYPCDKITCDKCARKETCPFAYDDYNLNGDCLDEV
jgi:hypothetical protein